MYGSINIVDILSWAFLSIVLGSPVSGQDSAVLTRIGFGSCAHQNDPQKVWDAVIRQKPDLFLLLGDNIYASDEDPAHIIAQYVRLGNKPSFQRLRAEVPVMAIWDDHDFGQDDGGGDYPFKEMSKAAFLQFFRVPESDPRHQRAGIYHARIFGPPGRRVQIIMLDTRYFRSRLKTIPDRQRQDRYDRYLPDASPEKTMLGVEQWTWLKQQLTRPAELRLIVSSIQVHHLQHRTERWYNFPLELKRLYRLLQESRQPGIMILSGNPHMSEISRTAPGDDGWIGYPLYEITSSGLTESWNREVDQPNRFRIGKAYGYRNFAQLVIDWDRDDPLITIEIRDEMGKRVEGHAVSLRALQPADGPPAISVKQ